MQMLVDDLPFQCKNDVLGRSVTITGKFCDDKVKFQFCNIAFRLNCENSNFGLKEKVKWTHSA
ncbi:MAG: hypothetical protein NVSMB56_04220 [Pyrinomonadaceae bacterium]